MKKIVSLLACVFVFASFSAWAADCEVSTGANAVTKGLDASCTNIIIASDITLTNTTGPIDITNTDVVIYGKTGSEKISGSLDSSPLVAMSANRITVRNLKIENTSSEASSYGILVGTGTTGGNIYNVDFVDCSQECVHVLGTSSIDAYQNSFRGITYDKAIVYAGGTHTAPSFADEATFNSDASGWLLDLTGWGSSWGTVEVYVKSGNDIVPAVTNRTDAGTTASVEMSFSYLPSGTFYALFTHPTSGTSVFSAGNEIDWTVPTGFDWGDYSDCRTAAWFTASGGQWNGDYDGDGVINGAEDADHDCTLDTGETTPTSANSAPTAPTLVSPADGATNVAVDVKLTWDGATDSNTGDTLTYRIYACTASNFTSGCAYSNSEVSSAKSLFDSNLNYALGFSALLLAGGLSWRGRGEMFFICLFAAVTFGSFASCGGSDSSSTITEGNLSYSTSGLARNTTYYWKVTVSDGTNGAVSSATRSFTTTP